MERARSLHAAEAPRSVRHGYVDARAIIVELIRYIKCGCSSVDRVSASEGYSHPGCQRNFEYWSF